MLGPAARKVHMAIVRHTIAVMQYFCHFGLSRQTQGSQAEGPRVPHQFRGSLGSDVGLGTRMRPLLSWCINRTLPNVCFRSFSSLGLSNLGSRFAAISTSPLVMMMMSLVRGPPEADRWQPNIAAGDGRRALHCRLRTPSYNIYQAGEPAWLGGAEGQGDSGAGVSDRGGF